MSQRTTIILGVIATALVAYIFFYERHLLSTAELEGRQGRLLAEFVRDRVGRVEIEKADASIVLVRGPERPPILDGEDPEPGKFALEQPMRAPADEDAVGSLLGALEWASARRTIENVSDADLHTFGLDSPRLRASFRVADREISIAFGNEDVHGGGVYVRVGDERTVHVAGKDLYEAVDHDADHFRSKDLLGEVEGADATAIAIGGTTIEKRDRTWFAGAILASSARVDALLTAVEDLRAQRFAPAGARLGDVERDVSLTIDRVAHHLRTGVACEGHADERYARMDEGPLVCVLASALDDVPGSADALHDPRPITVRDEDVHAIQIDRNGTTLRVEKGRDGFSGTLTSGGTTRSFEVDPQAVLDFMRAARGARATAVTAGTSDDQVPTATLRVFLEPDEDDAPRDGGAPDAGAEGFELVTQIEIVDTGSGDIVAVRALDRAHLVLPATASELFDPTPLRFRARRVLDIDEHDVTHVVVERPGARPETLSRSDETWKVDAPIEIAADGPSMRELLRDLSSLTAVRFVAASASPEHGLAPPRATATFTIGANDHPTTRTLEIGADVDDGAIARLGGADEVFVVSASLARLLTAPLASRELLSSEPDDIQRIAIEVPNGAPIALEREGEELVAAQGTTLSSERARAIADALASLRAAEVKPYGTAMPTTPRRTVRVTRTGEAAEPHEYVFEIFGEEGEGRSVRVLARRTDVPLVLAFTPEAMAALLE